MPFLRPLAQGWGPVGEVQHPQPLLRPLRPLMQPLEPLHLPLSPK